MIELPEALSIAKQLDSAVRGRTVKYVLPPTKPHKFCWFSSDPSEYDALLKGDRIAGTEGFGIYAELVFESGKRLSINDGVNVRYTDIRPTDWQLLISLEGLGDESFLVFTIAMYGGILLQSGESSDRYYVKSRTAVSPLSPEFKKAFYSGLESCKTSASAKAFLATEQRFPGIGNGTLQDILFTAGIHPKRKLLTLTDADRERLYTAVVSVLREMTELGGRDTEKDIFGKPCGYVTKMSKNALSKGCPSCDGAVVKETYLGGTVYYCPVCQPYI